MDTPTLRLIDTGPLPYLLSVPAAHESAEHESLSAEWPVLCFLHGYDEGAPLPIRRALTRHGPLRPGHTASPDERFVIIAPQLPRRGDLWHRYASAVHRILATVQAEQRGDPRRTYLCGFSFGGNGVFDLALAQPARWAALWAVDPTRVPPRGPDRPLWLSVGEVARRQRPAFIRALNLHPFHERPNGDRLYRDDGLDHVATARRAFDDANIYRWLLSKRLPSPT